MRALILAAGRGSRMRSLTATAPKCLVKIAGRSLLDWQLSALQAGGVERVAVVRGYQAEALNGPGYETFDNPRWEETNMVATLTCADPWLQQGDCIVSYSDIAYHPSIVRTLAATPGDIVMSYDRWWKQLWTQRFENPLGDAETFQCGPDGRLSEIGGRTDSVHRIHGQYMGLLKFTAQGWQKLAAFLAALPDQERDKLDMTGLFRRLIAEGWVISTVPIEGKWCEVDSDEDLRFYEQRLEQSVPWRHDWRWQEMAA